VYNPIFIGFGAARGISTEMESFVDTQGFLLLSGYTHIVSKQRTKFIFIDSMSSRKKLRTRAIACAALYIIFNEEEKSQEKNMGKKLRLDRDRYGHMPLLR
jgi:hypothetical protein